MRPLGAPWGITAILGNLARTAQIAGDHPLARRHLEEATAIERRVGRRAALAGCLRELGDVLRNGGDSAAARNAYAESLALWRVIGNQRRAAEVDERLARLDPEEAITTRAPIEA